ncbi:hypothetical protein Kalk_10940 [Ketobacter alkanivorans]|uniref:Serine protease n=2 Tax=Ketobacter alkanivorans TaxID=1917421 RepID=A0A2K9LKL9_9GAMM|nr:hypothetical protein Kalk_10940 [Ketobacter alkanivorans]
MCHRILFAACIMIASASALAGNATIETTLQPNVAAVTAKIGNRVEKGFAIVIGENKDKYYFATANHVVRGKTSREKTESISVQFHLAEALKFDADLHSVSDRKYDIAFFTVKKHQQAIRLSAHNDRPPMVLFRWDSMGSPNSDLVGRTVSSIGKLGKWEVISKQARIERQESPYLYIKNLNVDKGSSGSPLLDENGFIGLLTDHDADSTKAISLTQVKALAQKHGIPWNLSERATETDLSGTWQVQEKWEGDSSFEAPTSIELTHLDLVRFKIHAAESGAKGFGIIQGRRAKVWWDSNLWGDEFGEFSLKSDSNNTISLHGRAVDEDSGEEYQIRVTRLGAVPESGRTNGIAGCWNMQNLGTMTINPDNTAISGPFQGRLYALGSDHYEILWNRFVDKLTLSADRRTLQGSNNYAWPITAQKVDGATGSISGTWNWGGQIMTFQTDGSVSVNTITVGRWLSTKHHDVEVHWLSRLGYFVRYQPNAPTLMGTMGIRFETIQPVPNIEIGPLFGKRC